MIWQMICLKQAICERQEVEPYLCQLAKVFWRFSQFHGQYQSLPPPECSEFISHSEKRKNQQTNLEQ